MVDASDMNSVEYDKEIDAERRDPVFSRLQVRKMNS